MEKTMTLRACPKCASRHRLVNMESGVVMQNTMVTAQGIPETQAHRGATLSPIGPVEFVQCAKCPACGHSEVQRP